MVTWKDRRKNAKSFTLAELLAVVLIISSLALITVSKVQGVMQKSRQAEAIIILSKMYKGYKEMIVDGVLDPNTYDFPRRLLTDGSQWDPNIDAGTNRAWEIMGFDTNPNAEAKAYFTYDFWPKSWPRATVCPPMNAVTAGKHLGIAIRRTTRVPYSRNYDCLAYIFIDVDTGNITKSAYYR